MSTKEIIPLLRKYFFLGILPNKYTIITLLVAVVYIC